MPQSCSGVKKRYSVEGGVDDSVKDLCWYEVDIVMAFIEEKRTLEVSLMG